MLKQKDFCNIYRKTPLDQVILKLGTTQREGQILIVIFRLVYH